MQVQISDRTHSLPAELRAYAEERVKSLGDHLDLVAGADVEFIRDLKKRPEPLHVVKINLHLTGHRLPGLRASATGHDPRITFDLALDKISDEVDQLKERVKAHP
jgi:ribosomal subunit interface protein